MVAGLSNLSSRLIAPLLLEELKKLGGFQLDGKIGILLFMKVLTSFCLLRASLRCVWTRFREILIIVAMGHLHQRIKASFGEGELGYPGSQ